jgi:nitroreductase/cold shock CspA family protein
MLLPIETTFKNLPVSDPIEDLIRREAAKLERFFAGITRCRVLIEKPYRHHRSGGPYVVRIELDVRGTAIVINSSPSGHATIARTEELGTNKRDERDAAHKDLQLAVQDAFRKAGRRLQDYVRQKTGAVKVHEPLPTGVVRLLQRDDGFLRTADDRDIYFHRNSIRNNAFGRLHVGSMVRFVEEQGDEGPQASTVTLVRQRREKQSQRRRLEPLGMDVTRAIYGRRAIRAYTQEPVSRHAVERLIDAAVQAPSAMDLEPWSFAVVEGAERLRRFSDLAKQAIPQAVLETLGGRLRATLADPNYNIFHGAPVLIVICATSDESQAEEDCCLAAQNLMLAAHAIGLGTCPIGFARPWLRLPETKKELNIEANHIPVLSVVVGHPAECPAGPGRRAPTIVLSEA